MEEIQTVQPDRAVRAAVREVAQAQEVPLLLEFL